MKLNSSSSPVSVVWESFKAKTTAHAVPHVTLATGKVEANYAKLISGMMAIQRCIPCCGSVLTQIEKKVQQNK